MSQVLLFPDPDRERAGNRLLEYDRELRGNPLLEEDSQIDRFKRNIGPWIRTLPGRVGEFVERTAGLPGDVYAGRVDPRSDEAIERSLDLAGVMALGATAAPRGALGSGAVRPSVRPDLPMDEAYNDLASKTARMYNPPNVEPRSFAADYPGGGVSDASGRLQQTIEGDDITARYVAGRRMVGEGDEAIPTAEYDAIATGLTGRDPTAVASREIRGDAGRVVRDRRSGNPTAILFDRDLGPDQAKRVVGHELGHVTDILSGEIPTAKYDDALRDIYNTMNNPQAHGKKFGPEQHGYKGADVQRELMAEAIRAYMADPNYIKKVAPELAESIRRHVNTNPQLRNIIQFNSLGAGALGAGALAVPMMGGDEQ